ncbi:hypothetical protein [Anatilimnocola floriformis]|uniref:hypothetical protein n=1 Tax=Anatilimnocola floriformis TaxID=2948575 RepID=UPI0020C25778|nr:hypothetical protein [Anatilimnocola floriformis]
MSSFDSKSPKSLAILAHQLQRILSPADRLARVSPPPLLFDYDQFEEILKASIDGWPQLASSLIGEECRQLQTVLVTLQRSLQTLIDARLSDEERQVHFQLELNRCREQISRALQSPP